MPQPQTGGIIRFGLFELDPKAGVLRKRGVRIRLQDQPFRVLLALIDKRGEVVTREELNQKVSSGAAFGDFDHSLNIAINKIREALGDSAENPRFVETLPRRGYRFIAPVEGGAVGSPTPLVANLTAQSPAAAPPAPPPVLAATKERSPRWVIVAGFAVAVLAARGGAAAWLSQSPAPQLEWRRLTNESSAKTGPVLSDGARLYFRTGFDPGIHQIPASGGEPTLLPVTVPGPFSQLLDIAPGGEEFLLAAVERAASDFDLRYDVRYLEAGPLWILRMADGSTRRVGNLVARDARYPPDGQRIAFTSGGTATAGSLWVASADGAQTRRLLELKDVDIVLPCWSPDGKGIAFGQRDPATQRRTTWNIGVDGTGLRRVLPDFQRDHLPAGWDRNGGLLLISEGQFWIAEARRLFQLRRPAPIQLSGGDPLFSVPIQLQNGRTFYSVGTTRLGELQRFDTRSESWEPYLGGISADSLAYSRDGQRLVYTTQPQRELWVRRVDGTHPVQLTRAPMQVWWGRWSPDDRIIAFAARSAPGQPWRIYLVDAVGGNAREACPKDCLAFDLDWMPDGKKIVFGAPLAIFATDVPHLSVLDLATGEVSKLPGSDGFHSPRVSPDGSMLAALVYPTGGLRLYRFSDGVWTKPSNPLAAPRLNGRVGRMIVNRSGTSCTSTE